jgi:hypothetical protein
MFYDRLRSRETAVRLSALLVGELTPGACMRADQVFSFFSPLA